HLKTTGKSKMLHKWMPHELNDSQINLRLEVPSSLLLHNQYGQFLSRFLGCDEKWTTFDNRRQLFH
ncbi:hypothetical protein Angca_009878, partial [Angiostrongylus cantonensis]